MEKKKLDPVEARLNRIEGQIKAVKRMYSECEGCTEVVQQIQATRAALAKVASLLLTSEAKKCVEKGDVKELERVVDKTFKTM